MLAAFVSGISPIYTKNNKSPKTEPCGTQHSIGYDLLLIFLITILKKRFFKKDLINLIRYTVKNMCKILHMLCKNPTQLCVKKRRAHIV